MDKGPDQDARNDPNGLVEAIAEDERDDDSELYVPADQLPEKMVRKPATPDDRPTDELDLDSLGDTIEPHAASWPRSTTTSPTSSGPASSMPFPVTT